MLELPTNDPTNPIKLADWLEISSVLSLDSDASHGDLESALRIASFDGITDSEEVERKVLDVFDELEQRESAAAHAYPFSLESGVLKLKSEWKNYPAYIFCLFLSYFGVKETRETPKLFEGISCQAAKNYIKGDAVGFGSPRKDLPASFSDAITQLSRLLGEGGFFCGEPTLSRKDDTLDVVAWVDFIDKRPSKIILFGQCAAGENWDEKLADLQPDAFWRQWMAESLVSPTPIKSFFIPHRIDKEKWNFIARKAGVMFERCRVAYWAHEGELNFSRHIEWIQQQIVLQKSHEVL
ncbi:MAG: hypothetical protein KJ606_08420 [Chloroflexi bacterium]|nr:hypothetical protein [Chloroflexota bacterium]